MKNPNPKPKERNPRQDFYDLYDAGFYPWGGVGDSKAPYGKGWQRFGEEVPSKLKIEDFLSRRPSHIGIILPLRESRPGERPVRITVFDCECAEIGRELMALMWEICPELEDKIAIRENTKSGGVHIYVQHPFDTPFSNVRLYDKNIVLKKPGHENAAKSGKGPLVFEVLGACEGAKYCIVYASGRKYLSENGLEDLRTLTQSEMEQMEKVLERLAELHPSPGNSTTKKKSGGKETKKHVESFSSEIREFDSYIDVCALLEEAGWSFDHEDEDRWYYTRPGKKAGTSATVLKENQLMHVFTSSTDFKDDETYTPFQVYALLKHGINKGGTYKNVIRELKRKRYEDAVKENAEKTPLTLPSMGGSISQCAAYAFEPFAEKEELFYRGGKVQEILRDNGDERLEVLSSERFCSVLERYFYTQKWQDKPDGPELKDTPCTKNIAEVLLATDAAKELLPEVTILSAGPILAFDGRVVQQGYDAATKCYVLSDLEVDVPSVKEAVRRIKRLLGDFKFQSDSDFSRAIAAFLTPALAFGGFLKRIPLMFLEADQSQTGKGYFVRSAAAIYGEQARLVVQRSGGVGSFDESLASRLAAGNPFISIDNLRGKLDSQYLEAMLTAEGYFNVRLPYRGEIQIDSRQYCLFGTSNAVELTRDTANRMSIIRLRKQPEGYEFKQWKEGDLVEHIAANRRYLLGAVFAVLREWIDRGKPRTDESRHDFREWAQSLDWIVRNIFDEAPLMDGFIEAKERISNSSLGFVRQLGVIIEQENKLSMPLSASSLYSLCGEHGLEVPNCRENDEQAGRLQIGKIFGRHFDKGNRLAVDEYLVVRGKEDVRREDGKGLRPTYCYSFYRSNNK